MAEKRIAQNSRPARRLPAIGLPCHTGRVFRYDEARLGNFGRGKLCPARSKKLSIVLAAIGWNGLARSFGKLLGILGMVLKPVRLLPRRRGPLAARWSPGCYLL